jgi:hypothetical protein
MQGPASAPMMLKAMPVQGTGEGQTGTVDPSGTEFMIKDVPTAFAKAAESIKKLSDETARLAELAKTRELTADEWKNYRWLKADAQNYLRLLERLEPQSAKPKGVIPGEGMTGTENGVGDKPMGGSAMMKNCPPKPVQNSDGFWTKLMGPKVNPDCLPR